MEALTLLLKEYEISLGTYGEGCLVMNLDHVIVNEMTRAFEVYFNLDWNVWGDYDLALYPKSLEVEQICLEIGWSINENLEKP